MRFGTAVPTRRASVHVVVLATLALLTAATLACERGSAADAPALATPEIDTLPGGGIAVHNPGPTAWADTVNGWRLVEAGRLGGAAGEEDADADGALIDPREAVVDAAGRLYVADATPPAIKVYDRSGRFLKTIGREGAGPGKFRSILLAIHGPHLVVHDPQLARTTVFDTSGAYLRSWPSACCHWRDIAVDRDGRIFVPTMSESRPEYAAAFLRYTIDGALVDTVWVPKDGEPRMWEMRRSGMTARWSIPNTPHQVIAFTHDGMLLRSWTEGYRFVVSRGVSDTVQLVSRDFEPVPWTEEERRAFHAQFIERHAKRWDEVELRRTFRFGDLPTVETPIEAITVDPLGYRWVRIASADRSRAWMDVFDTTGAYLGAVPFPAGVHPGHATWIGADELVTINQDGEGLPFVLRLRIERHEPAPTGEGR